MERIIRAAVIGLEAVSTAGECRRFKLAAKAAPMLDGHGGRRRLEATPKGLRRVELSKYISRFSSLCAEIGKYICVEIEV